MMTVGDLSTTFQLRRDNAFLKQSLTRIGSEISSGRVFDLSGHLKGNFDQLGSLERGLSRTESFLSIISEQRLETEAVQSSLENIRLAGNGLSNALLIAQGTENASLVLNAGKDALTRFSSAISNLNTTVGGRYLFSGIAVDQPATIDADAIVSALETAIADGLPPPVAGDPPIPATTAEDVETIVRSWFSVGGGFDLDGYTGSTPIPGTAISDNASTQASITAARDELREALTGFALGALVASDLFAADPVENGRLARIAAEAIFEGDTQLVGLQAAVGSNEGTIARTEARLRAESEAFELARSRLIGVDPYEKAVELSSTEARLEALYALTAKLSRLSLTDYL